MIPDEDAAAKEAGVSNHGLFGPIRRDHFRLFSGGAAHFYADIVRHLEARVFELAMEPVSRKELLREIKAFLDARAWKEALQEEIDEEVVTSETAPIMIYNRLVQCHWLVEQREGYRRLVDLDADARLLLQALEDIASGRVRSFGAEVLKVLTLLRSAVEDPTANGLNIRSAASGARQFLVNLKAIATAIRSAEQDMVLSGSAEGILRGFFKDYISNNLVADYRELRSGNNPYRFRGEIVQRVEETLAEPDRVNALAETFVSERLAKSFEEAREMVEEDLRKTA